MPLPHGESMWNLARARASSSTPLTRTSPVEPNVITPAPVRDRIAATRSSSALSTAVPLPGNASISSPLANATPSIPPTSSVCA